MSSLKLPLETARLHLRHFERADINAIGRYHSQIAAQRYLVRPCRDAGEMAIALDIMRSQVSLQRPGDTLALAMVRKGDRGLIGQVSLNWSDATARQAEIRHAIDPAEAGQGYLAEALSAMFDLAFGHFHIHRVFCRCDGRNHHSIKLMQKLGMRLEAHYREHALFQGEWDEELHFAILDREWRKAPGVEPLLARNRVA